MPIVITGPAPAQSDMSVRYAMLGRAMLRAYTRHQNRQNAYLAYLTAPNDGFGGEFIYSDISTVADDGMDVLKPDDVDVSSPGRWIRANNLT